MTRRATVVGAGPNGLAAAVSLARAGYDVEVMEAAPTAGGGLRTLDGPAPGHRFDVGSAVHPAALSSPFFSAFGIRERVEWLVPEASFAQPLDDGPAAIAWRDIRRTEAELGVDGAAWRRLAAPLNSHLSGLVDAVGSHLLRVPADPVTAARFALRIAVHGTRLGASEFRTPRAAALLAGVLAHANTRMPSIGAAASGIFLLAHAHSVGWPLPRGGAQSVADALLADLARHGGRVSVDRTVTSLADLDAGDAEAGDVVLLDTSPRLALTHPDIPDRYARAIRRFRYGAAAAKVDFAIDGAIPWRDPRVSAAPTVHLGGTAAEVAASENAVARGELIDRPYVLLVQPSVVDDTRAPAGRSTVWAYIHVPANSPVDPTEPVIRQIERFAPGFRDRIVASRAMPASEREAFNPADIGGDILGGAFSLAQAVRRPVVSRTPWRTPMKGVYLASASTPPGPGITGMPGWYAARQVLRDAGTPAGLGDLFD